MSTDTKRHDEIDTPRRIRACFVIVEAKTPIMVGAGHGDIENDALVVTDMHGLPVIPGTTIAGALRATMRATMGEELAATVFGRSTPSETNRKNAPSGLGSALVVTWAHILDRYGRPVDGSEIPAANDPVLEDARRGIHRDHVKIDHRGVAEDRRKFDERAVAAGHRFAFRIELLEDGHFAEGEAEIAWETLLATIDSADFRIGGRSRRGFGSLRAVSVLTRHYEIGTTGEFDEYARLDARLHEESVMLGAGFRKWEPTSDKSPRAPRYQTIDLTLRAESFWLIGGGDSAFADAAPLRETRITWDGGGPATVVACYVVPGSGIKGALAHRTAYHFNRRSGIFAEDIEKKAQGDAMDEQSKPRAIDHAFANAASAEGNRAVFELFGEIHCTPTGADHRRRGRIGRVIIDDVFMPIDSENDPEIHMKHVGLDRFTGGARDGVLYDATLRYGTEIRIRIWVGVETWSEHVRDSLDDALRDLREGLLTIGAGASRGHGRFVENHPNRGGRA